MNSKLLLQFDTDFSGQIEFPEFCNMMSAKMGPDNDEELIRAAFRVLDNEGNGKIKSSEFRHLMTCIGIIISSYKSNLFLLLLLNI